MITEFEKTSLKELWTLGHSRNYLVEYHFKYMLTNYKLQNVKVKKREIKELAQKEVDEFLINLWKEGEKK